MIDSNTILQVSNLTKDFGSGAGVFGLNLELKPGEIVGFIGPNGAGKTTTMASILGFLTPDKGKVEIFGKVFKPSEIYQIMPEIGVLMSDIEFEGYLTPRQIIDRSKKLKPKVGKEYADQLIKDLGIQMDKKYSKLSLGNKRKVGVLIAVMTKPKLLIFDEPTAGLDPLVQRTFLKIIKDLAAQGSSILLSSHVLSEVQTICDRVVMIKKGKLIYEGTVKEIFENSPKIFKFASPQDHFEKLISSQDFVTETKRDNQELLVYTDDPESALRFLIEHKVYQFYLERPSLEELFIDSY
jgi:ABC-2 type transport system ATP-binding protein